MRLARAFARYFIALLHASAQDYYVHVLFTFCSRVHVLFTLCSRFVRGLRTNAEQNVNARMLRERSKQRNKIMQETACNA
jgi:hypothetical protein